MPNDGMKNGTERGVRGCKYGRKDDITDEAEVVVKPAGSER